MKLLIVYATTEGQTKKICEFLRDEAKKTGHEVSLNNALEFHVHSTGFYTAIVGASLHAEKYQAAIEHYVQENHEELNKIPSAFLSVSLTAATDEPESWKELKQITQGFLDKTGWQPTFVEQVAGALRYSKYNFLKKFIMRMIAQKQGGDSDTSKDYEYTDWDQVKSIIDRLDKAVKEKTFKKTEKK